MGTVLAAIKLGWHQNGLVEPALFWQASLVDTAKEACGEKLDESTPGRPCTLSPEFGGANTPREYSGENFPRIREISPRKTALSVDSLAGAHAGQRQQAPWISASIRIPLSNIYKPIETENETLYPTHHRSVL